MSRFPSGRPRTRLHRVRLFLGFSLVQVEQSQPIDGTPTDVPVPRNTSSPVISMVRGILGMDGSQRGHGYEQARLYTLVRCQWSVVSCSQSGVSPYRQLLTTDNGQLTFPRLTPIAKTDMFT